MEKNFWTLYEDNILQLLKVQRKVQRWTDIARILSTEFQIKGRNGKQCRERYQERFDSSTQTSNWSFEEEKILFTLHNELGNKWAIISRKMNGRSDNCIKNHFYSRLRKGLKRMNQVVQENLVKSFKETKFNILFKIIEATEDGYKNNVFCQVDTSKRCFEIKNKLVVLSYDDEEEHDLHPEDIDCVGLYNDITDFNRNYKRKPKKFRRIPTKGYGLKQRQNSCSDIQLKSTKSNIELEEDESQEQVNKMENEEDNNKEKQFSIECEQFFGEYQSQFYKANESKNSKKRRESAQTTGIERILCGSGILEEEEQLPMLDLRKKGTSYFSFLGEQPVKENTFFNQNDPNSDCFLMKDLMSLKRLSHTESRLFD